MKGEERSSSHVLVIIVCIVNLDYISIGIVLHSCTRL